MDYIILYIYPLYDPIIIHGFFMDPPPWESPIFLGSRVDCGEEAAALEAMAAPRMGEAWGDRWRQRT